MNDICDYKLSLKLKKAGYKEWCRQGWGLDIRHNGQHLGSDEEYELKAEGKGDEIEYIPGGAIFEGWCNNSAEWWDEDTCSAPLINDVIDWLETEKGILVVPELRSGISSYVWRCSIFTFVKGKGVKLHITTTERSKKYDSLSEGIEYALYNLIEEINQK